MSGLFDVVSQGCASKFAELAFEVGNDRVEFKFSICDEINIYIYVYLALHCFQSWIKKKVLVNVVASASN